MTDEPIKILLIDDSSADYMLTCRLFKYIQRKQFTVEWVSNYEDGFVALLSNEYDLALLDHRLGFRTGLELLTEVAKRNCQTPIIILTGAASYGLDIAAMKAGAADYLVKGEITPDQLERSIRYALSRKEVEQDRQALHGALQEKLAHELKILSGLLPICVSCKKIRDDQGYWKQLEVYIRDHSEANFSHGFCPECSHKILCEVRDYNPKPA